MSKNLTGISLLTDRAAGFKSDFGMKWRGFTYALVVFHSTNDPVMINCNQKQLMSCYFTEHLYIIMSLVGGARRSFLKIKCRSCFRVSEAVSSHNHVDLGCSCLLSLLPTEFVYCRPVLYSIISYGNFRVYRPYSVVTNISYSHF